MKHDFGVAVIGGGSAGLTAAGFAAQLGVSTVIFEAGDLGGDCTWSGCVPSKALIHAAHEAKLRSGKEMDYSKVFHYVQKKIQEVYTLETPQVMESKGVRVMKGRAEFKDEHTLLVHLNSNSTAQKVTAKKIIICTGAHPRKPKTVQGLWDAEIKDRV